MIRLKFIGADGSMRLRRGQYYLVEIYTTGGYLWVKWYLPEINECPYSSLKALTDNWTD